MFAVFRSAASFSTSPSFGRLITAIGSNEEAVRLSGIAVPRYILAVYVISGALAAVSRGSSRPAEPGWAPRRSASGQS